MTDQTIGFKVTFEEKERLKALAEQNNLRLSDYIRQELLDESNKACRLHQAISLLLFYNGCSLEEASIEEIDFIIDVFEEAMPKLNGKQSSLLNQLISILSEVKTEVERKGEHSLNIADFFHELWLNFLNPALQE